MCWLPIFQFSLKFTDLQEPNIDAIATNLTSILLRWNVLPDERLHVKYFTISCVNNAQSHGDCGETTVMNVTTVNDTEGVTFQKEMNGLEPCIVYEFEVEASAEGNCSSSGYAEATTLAGDVNVHFNLNRAFL